MVVGGWARALPVPRTLVLCTTVAALGYAQGKNGMAVVQRRRRIFSKEVIGRRGGEEAGAVPGPGNRYADKGGRPLVFCASGGETPRTRTVNKQEP